MVSSLLRQNAARALVGSPLGLGLLAAGVIPVFWLGASLAVAYRLTRRTGPPLAEPVPSIAWGKVESLRLATRDGHEIGAWLIPGGEEAPSVLLLHANRGSRSSCLSRAGLFVSQGCTAMMISFRAHGDSTGRLNDIGFGARHDVIAAVDFLERRRPGKPIIILGTSLGSAAAVFASKELGHRVQGYILECPYQDLKVAVRNSTKTVLPPVLDWIAYRGLLSVSRVVLPGLEQISPLAAIEGIPEDVPVLILAGGQDRRTYPQEAKALHDRVRSHGRLVLFEQAGHVNILESYPDQYRQFVIDFIRAAGRLPTG